LMMSLWDALRMNMMISYQELVRTFPNNVERRRDKSISFTQLSLNAISIIKAASSLSDCLIIFWLGVFVCGGGY
ncbi:hypothetical protein, partial [Klebsiella pneumoniae]